MVHAVRMMWLRWSRWLLWLRTWSEWQVAYFLDWCDDIFSCDKYGSFTFSSGGTLSDGFAVVAGFVFPNTFASNVHSVASISRSL
jgi:hypothetical protein